MGHVSRVLCQLGLSRQKNNKPFLIVCVATGFNSLAGPCLMAPERGQELQPAHLAPLLMPLLFMLPLLSNGFTKLNGSHKQQALPVSQYANILPMHKTPSDIGLLQGPYLPPVHRTLTFVSKCASCQVDLTPSTTGLESLYWYEVRGQFDTEVSIF